MTTKQKITEEMKVHSAWKAEAKEQTVETVEKFIRHLIENYEHDYGTIVHACFAAMLAGFSAMDKSAQGGITGFQAGCLMWECVEEFGMMDTDCGAAIVCVSDLLYPQYDYKRGRISASAWEKLQAKAAKQVAENSREHVHAAVFERWESIARGEVPCGLVVETKES